VAYVLHISGQTQISFTIIKTIIIDVVNHKTIWGFRYLAVHRDDNDLAGFSVSSMVFRIKGVPCLVGTPLVPAEPIVIVGVNDGEFALRQGYAAKCVAISQPAIEKDRQDTEPFEPRRDFDYDLDGFLSLCVMENHPKIRNPNIEARNNLKIRSSNVQNNRFKISGFGHPDLATATPFVSNFVIRILNLLLRRCLQRPP